jgi:4'-phosphopantetheinyl transferase EntD
MSSPLDVQAALEAIAPSGVVVGCRAIAEGDENALLLDEAQAWRTFALPSRRASGAARSVARDLLAQFGHPNCSLPKSPGGAPVWPHGVVGSLAHDRAFAVAAIGSRRNLAGLGIDIEPAERLPEDILHIVCTPRERTAVAGDLLAARGLFAAKEAVYKAVNPIDGMFLEHHDVEVDLARHVAVVRGGRSVVVQLTYIPRIVAIAYIEQS